MNPGASPVLQRRRLLKLATAAVTVACWPGLLRSAPRFDRDPFELGVASGSPTHDSVVLWTRLVAEGFFGSILGDEPIPVTWEVAHDEGFNRIVRSGRAVAVPELAHSVHVEVEGLAPDRWYFYRFMAGDARSPVGRTRTFPAPDAAVARLRLAYASCQRWEHGYFSAWRHMAGEELDLVLFLGDYIYEYPNAARAVRVPPGGWVITLDDYRRRYALHKSEPELKAMHAACPWLVVWDDHEVQNNYAGAQAGDNGPPVADFARRRAAAYQAFYEHMPLRSSVLTKALAGLASGAEMRIHAEVRYGRLANFFLLDDRQYRDPQACTLGGRRGSSRVDPATCASWTDPRRSLLGAAQEAWLDDAFGRSGALWNVLGQQTLFSRRDFRRGPGQSLWNDGWDGYPVARDRLIASIRRQRLANPVLLGGDLHENWVGHVKADYADPASAAIGVEFCGTSITSREAEGRRVAAWLAENPHFVFADTERRGYGVVQLTPASLTTTLRVVSDVTRRDATVETLAQFAVPAGRSVIERV